MHHRQLKIRSEKHSDHLVRGHFQQYRDEIQDLVYSVRNESKVLCAFFPELWMKHQQMQVSETDLSHIMAQFAQAEIPLIYETLGPEKKESKMMLNVLEDKRLRDRDGIQQNLLSTNSQSMLRCKNQQFLNHDASTKSVEEP